jgi:hypothetical protein
MGVGWCCKRIFNHEDTKARRHEVKSRNWGGGGRGLTTKARRHEVKSRKVGGRGRFLTTKARRHEVKSRKGKKQRGECEGATGRR